MKNLNAHQQRLAQGPKCRAFFPPSVFSLCSMFFTLLLLAVVFTGCAVGPNYQRPATPDAAAYKEAGPWTVAAPADALERGPWWELFNDSVLNDLAARVEVSNQNVAAAVAAYAQSRALVAEQRAGLWPSLALSAGANRSASGGGQNNAGGSRQGNNFSASLGAAWEPDVWGRLQRIATGADASASASAADLATAKLSAHGELAANYFSLRQQDVQKALLTRTLAGFTRALDITQNRYTAGIVARSDVLQAQTQLANAQADLLGVNRSRAQLEHAIAVLVGQTPSSFTLIADASWSALVPDVPPGVPSSLLQRRPDVAAAERRVASANEQIGIAKTAYYPSVNLSASAGAAGSRLADLFGAPSALWSLGLSAAQVLFKGGAIDARVDAATAAHAQTVARYRQVVLTAFQNIEDQLSSVQALEAQQALRLQASSAADLVEQQALNRYTAGRASFLEVITAQTAALNARRAVAQTSGDRLVTAVALIQSLGGGWQATLAQGDAIK